MPVAPLEPMRLSRSLVAVLLAVASVIAACGSSGDGEPAGHGGSSAGSGGATAGSGGSSAGVGGSRAGAGGSAAGHGGSTAGSGGASAGSSGAGGTGGELACGASVCGAGQYCVFPCCGGAPPPCFQAPESGECPVGSHVGSCIGGTGCTPPATCCQFDPCIPPPPYCSDTAPVGCITQQGRTCHLGCA